MPTDNPRRDWGLPGEPTTPRRKDVRTPKPCRDQAVLALVTAATVVGVCVVGLALAILRIDIRHEQAIEDGYPVPAFSVVVTPSPYGPPPR
jgi:hypothetical protein